MIYCLGIFNWSVVIRIDFMDKWVMYVSIKKNALLYGHYGEEKFLSGC